jgi:hypothetical protein
MGFEWFAFFTQGVATLLRSRTGALRPEMLFAPERIFNPPSEVAAGILACRRAVASSPAEIIVNTTASVENSEVAQ